MNQAIPVIAAMVSACSAMAGQSPAWTGQWIWANADGAKNPPNTWLCFRRQVEVPAGGVSVLRIAAENRYRLWIDGRVIVHDGGLPRGPAKDATWYDEVPVQLGPGRHVIAVLVWYWGRSAFDHISAGAPGFLLDAPEYPALSSSTDWKVLRHPAFLSSLHKPDKRLSEPSVFYDQGNNPGPWMQADFDDTGWSNAQVVAGVGKGPWGTLWRRPIPLMEWKESQLFPPADPKRKLPAGVMDAPVGPFTAAEGVLYRTRLPGNIQFVPRIRLRDPVGGQVITVPAGNQNGTQQHAWRTVPGEQTFEGVTWITVGTWGDVLWSIPAGIEVLELGYRESRYPLDPAGSFTSSDPFLDLLWQQSRATVAVNLRDTIMGCPDRERGGFLGDQNVDFCVLPYAFAPRQGPLVEMCVGNVVRWAHPNGALPCVAPGTFNGEFPAMTLTWMGPYGLHEHWRQTGNPAVWQLAWTAAKRYVDLFVIDAQGAVVDRPGGMNSWKDWGDRKQMDERLLMTCWYAGALQALIEAAPLVGQAAQVPELQQRLDRIRSAFHGLFWTGKGYRSPDATHLGQGHDDRGNALAVCFGLYDPTVARELIATIDQERRSGPMLEWHAIEALVRLGATDRAVARLHQRFAYIRNGSYTLGEFWGPANHGYAAGSLAVLSGWVAGVRPAKPGYAHISVLPRPGSLERIACTVPSVAGEISVQMQRGKESWELRVRLPAPADLGVPLDIFGDTSIAQVVDAQGTVLWTPAGTTATKTVRSLGPVDGHLRFAVPAGEWILRAQAAPSPAPGE